MMVQTIIMAIAVAAAFFLAGRAIWRALHCKKSAFTDCDDCPLAAKCDKSANTTKRERNNNK